MPQDTDRTTLLIPWTTATLWLPSSLLRWILNFKPRRTLTIPSLYPSRTGSPVAAAVFAALVVLLFQTALPPLLRRMVARERLWATVAARTEWHTAALLAASLANAFGLPLGAACILTPGPKGPTTTW